MLHPEELAGRRTASAVDGAGAVLDIVRATGGATVSELAAGLGVARSTVGQRLALLHDSGLVVSTSTGSGTRGRPAVTVRFAPEAGVVLAAQVGMSGSRLAVTDLTGTVLAETLRQGPVAAGPDAVLDQVALGFDDLLASLDREVGDVVGVGIGIPSRIELLTHVRENGTTIDGWDHEAVSERLSERFDAPVLLDLDVNLLALAEQAERWPDTEVFVCVKLGTVIDAAIVVRGAPIRGSSRLAGELGHVKTPGSSAPCSCGGTGCLEAEASGRALVAALSAEGLAVARVSDVVALVRSGDPRAIAAVRDAGRRIGAALASLVTLLNPGAIALWGYLTEAEAPLLAGIRETLHGDALPESGEGLELVTAALGELAGVRGAAAMVIDRVLDPIAVDRMLVSGSWGTGRPPAAVSA